MLKEKENPPTTWPENKSISEFDGNWFVAHTKSRNEKALAWDLIAKNTSYFLPMRWKIVHRKGRKLRSLLPLFSGYLFLCGKEKNRFDALKTNRIANMLEVKDQQQLISELSQIQQALNKGANLQPYKYIKTGQNCRVTAGPLKGLNGIATKTRGFSKLVLKIDMLGQAASVEIDTDTIEILN